MIDDPALEALETKLTKVSRLNLLNQSVESVRTGAELLHQHSTRLSVSLERVTNIARRRDIQSPDGSPATVDQLASGDGIKDVFPDLLIDDEVIRETRKSAEYLRSEVSILEMDKLQQQLRIIYDRISVALNEIEDYAGQIGLEYDRSQRAVAQLTILATIAAKGAN